MSALRARVEVAALQALLTGIGLLIALASRRSDRFRRQVTRNLLIEIRSADGARQQYRLHAATRRLRLHRRPAGRADCMLLFPTARVGLRTLLSRRTMTRIWSVNPRPPLVASSCARTLRCVSSTPFGGPVVPDV
jgi:hypothetical protein